ncbi:MAG: diadenylate cyclase CdaA [Bacteroidales bacterium]|jgi:uncharacterized protein (TIGR00159 family)|nr:diadenylate cyclase CdaA [Bacteroidales bacterium]
MMFLTAILGLRWIDFIDIVLVALLMYELYNLVKGTGAINIFIGIVAVFLLHKVVNALEMSLLSEILGAFISVGFIALIVVFQPEIRQFLLMLGTPSFMSGKKRRFLFWRLPVAGGEGLEIDPIIHSVQRMAINNVGALIVIARRHELAEFASTGEHLDARISDQLIETIFFKNSPLHDGAAIILNNKIIAARCILPVSGTHKISVTLGLRHRAALGITEKTDAIAVVVSEETGEISYCMGGTLVTNVKPFQLKNFLEKEFIPS